VVIFPVPVVDPVPSARLMPPPLYAFTHYINKKTREF